MKNRAGFTIIELLIAMTIMAFISIGVYQNVSKSFELRDRLTKDGDFYNSVRIAVSLFHRDIIHLYTPQAAALPGEIGKAQKVDPKAQNSDAFVPNNPDLLMDFWGPPINKEGVRPSRFLGESDKVTFVSNSHIRLYQDSQESEFIKITYAIEADKYDKSNESKVLVKYVDPDAFVTDDRKSEDTEVRYQLLQGVKNLKFRYLDGEKDTWFNRWDTAGVDHKDKFPSIIEISLEVEKPRSENSFVVTQRFRPELPL